MQSGAYCKGSMSLNTGCGKCEQCLVERTSMVNRSLGKNVYDWKYRVLGIRSGHFAYTDNRKHIEEMLSHGGFWVEPLYHEQLEIVEHVAGMEALFKIAFDASVNDLAADPSKWSSNIAYLALGGVCAGGKRLNTKEELELNLGIKCE
jgi:hypothetical protein